MVRYNPLILIKTIYTIIVPPIYSFIGVWGEKKLCVYLHKYSRYCSSNVKRNFMRSPLTPIPSLFRPYRFKTTNNFDPRPESRRMRREMKTYKLLEYFYVVFTFYLIFIHCFITGTLRRIPGHLNQSPLSPTIFIGSLNIPKRVL